MIFDIVSFGQAFQLSRGAELVGPLPDEMQRVTVFSAGVLTNAQQPEAAAELIQFLASPEAIETVMSTGLDPITRR